MNTAIIRRDWAGRIIDGRFPLFQWIGGSEQHGVFLTELPQGERSQKAVIKLIPAEATDATAQISRWAMITALSHPHLMPLFYAGRGELDGVPLLYTVTEHSEEILSQILAERPLTPTETREMLDVVIEALSYLHGIGYVHGHLKPSNILVVGDRLKLSSDDLHVAGKQVKHSTVSSVYDAPETATGKLLPAADIWSLGVTLVETLTGHPPAWERSTHREPVVPASIPQPFAGIVLQCLRIDPAHRCSLSDIKAHLEPAASLPASPGNIKAKRSSAKVAMLALIAAAFVVLAVVAGVWLRTPPAEQLSPSSSPTKTRQPAPAVSTLPPPAPVPSPAPSPSVHSPNGPTVKGAVAEQVLPDVPPDARQTIQGHVRVTVKVMVDAGGHVSNATLDQPGPSRYFARLALEAAQKWSFRPAQVDSQPVSSTWMLQFQFTQATTEVNPVEVAP